MRKHRDAELSILLAPGRRLGQEQIHQVKAEAPTPIRIGAYLVPTMPLDAQAQRKLRAAVQRWGKAMRQDGNDVPA